MYVFSKKGFTDKNKNIIVLFCGANNCSIIQNHEKYVLKYFEQKRKKNEKTHF